LNSLASHDHSLHQQPSNRPSDGGDMRPSMIKTPTVMIPEEAEDKRDGDDDTTM